ncbi:cation diffusion facilitator family transporter [Porphyromonas circumdentaria]|uniref:Cation diffusion facilitator family transporter n=1 Tax=Porphyromonas circumdentaria TaxID=29524 RepID=A0A1T4MKV8_9PORP|nr:cation diffusion facilitator family transporter [Porphyromonas circumdentaria]MBB6275842.1 cation diffusion facilitator family transporter [Porphyromonas circumdentaria]MDO4722386.1 cation diffusion facilitator family transporter [Porphyromonas circumdentaria]SJZ67388.1 cation diffusion facilitator family transporter [Porphyromonas circumdentaria]
MNPTHSVRKKKILKVSIISLLSNTLLTILKFVAGILGNSSALIADAANSLSDLITDIVLIVLVPLSCRPSNKRHKYGHGKYETLASAIIGMAMIVLGISLLVDAINTVKDVIHHQQVITLPHSIALVIALFSIAFKLSLFIYTKKKSDQLSSSSLRAKAFDHRNDVFTSLAVLIGVAAAMLFDDQWAILEPIAAGFVSLIISYTGVTVLVPALEELLEKSIPEYEEKNICAILDEEPAILSYHKLYTRRIGTRYAIEVDIRVKGSMSVRAAHDVTQELEDRLRLCFGPQTHIIIHVEPQEEKDRDEDFVPFE